MNVRRVGWAVAIAIITLLEVSCGDVYRPVVIPTSTTPPSPANFHAVFGLTTNIPGNAGTALQIDVSGDTNIGQADIGLNPTHAALLPNNSRVFVTTAGSALGAPNVDVVASFTPAAQSTTVSGLGTLSKFTLPNLANGLFCGYEPDFVTTAQANAAYVANFGSNCPQGFTVPNTDSVAVISPSTSSITNIRYLPAGSNPVALSETPNALNLYVVNQGNNTVTDLSPTDLSILTTIPLPGGSTPVWAVARPDSQRVFVLTQGDGKLYTIRTDTNAVDSGQSVGGPGANFLQYDKKRNRLYVTNPVGQAVYVFDATADPPALLATISTAAGASSPCPTGCSPVSIAALPDGSRFYVASYQTAPVCPDATLGNSIQCMIPMLSVFDAASFALKPAVSTALPSSPSLSLLSSSHFAAGQYAVPQVDSCATVGAYNPLKTRFRMFAAAAPDSSHVYVSICDAGTIADVVTTTSTIAIGNNTPDTLVTDIPAAVGGCSGGGCGSVATISAYQIDAGVVTFTAANSFTAGQRVTISGLSSSTGIQINGRDLTVIAAGLSGSTFECNLPANFSPSSAPATNDSGTAVPLNPPQTPVFLATGQ